MRIPHITSDMHILSTNLVRQQTNAAEQVVKVDKAEDEDEVTYRIKCVLAALLAAHPDEHFQTCMTISPVVSLVFQVMSACTCLIDRSLRVSSAPSPPPPHLSPSRCLLLTSCKIMARPPSPRLCATHARMRAGIQTATLKKWAGKSSRSSWCPSVTRR